MQISSVLHNRNPLSLSVHLKGFYTSVLLTFPPLGPAELPVCIYACMYVQLCRSYTVQPQCVRITSLSQCLLLYSPYARCLLLSASLSMNERAAPLIHTSRILIDIHLCAQVQLHAWPTGRRRLVFKGSTVAKLARVLYVHCRHSLIFTNIFLSGLSVAYKKGETRF